MVSFGGTVPHASTHQRGGLDDVGLFGELFSNDAVKTVTPNGEWVVAKSITITTIRTQRLIVSCEVKSSTNDLVHSQFRNGAGASAITAYIRSANIWRQWFAALPEQFADGNVLNLSVHCGIGVQTVSVRNMRIYSGTGTFAITDP